LEVIVIPTPISKRFIRRTAGLAEASMGGLVSAVDPATGSHHDFCDQFGGRKILRATSKKHHYSAATPPFGEIDDAKPALAGNPSGHQLRARRSQPDGAH